MHIDKIAGRPLTGTSAPRRLVGYVGAASCQAHAPIFQFLIFFPGNKIMTPLHVEELQA